MAGRRAPGLLPRSEALNRLPKAHPAEGEVDVSDALYPGRSLRRAEVRRTRILPGIDLADLEAVILASHDLDRGGRARLLSYARELADFYEEQSLRQPEQSGD